jgi:hypothetical protein
VKNTSSTSLRRRRKTLLRQLPDLEAILRGSVIERYKPCGKPGCSCAQGPGHGPKHYLSVSQSGGIRPKMDYVPQSYLEQIRHYLANYRRVREILEEICTINCELLRRRQQL